MQPIRKLLFTAKTYPCPYSLNPIRIKATLKSIGTVTLRFLQFPIPSRFFGHAISWYGFLQSWWTLNIVNTYGIDKFTVAISLFFKDRWKSSHISVFLASFDRLSIYTWIIICLYSITIHLYPLFIYCLLSFLYNFIFLWVIHVFLGWEVDHLHI